MKEKKNYYYRIYDDQEEKTYFKCSLTRKRIEKLVKDYEKKNQEYINTDFIAYIQKYDPDAEIIKVSNIFY